MTDRANKLPAWTDIVRLEVVSAGNEHAWLQFGGPLTLAEAVRSAIALNVHGVRIVYPDGGPGDRPLDRYDIDSLAKRPTYPYRFPVKRIVDEDELPKLVHTKAVALAREAKDGDEFHRPGIYRHPYMLASGVHWSLSTIDGNGAEYTEAAAVECAKLYDIEPGPRH